MPRSAGFDQDGFNSDIVPKYLPRKEQAVLRELWELLGEEARALGYTFTSAQVNKNFTAGWEARHAHQGKDTDFQRCASLGDFEGGKLCWLEGEGSCFSVSTRRVWQKMDGRHTHWVDPYEGD